MREALPCVRSNDYVERGCSESSGIVLEFAGHGDRELCDESKPKRECGEQLQFRSGCCTRSEATTAGRKIGTEPNAMEYA